VIVAACVATVGCADHRGELVDKAAMRQTARLAGAGVIEYLVSGIRSDGVVMRSPVRQRIASGVLLVLCAGVLVLAVLNLVDVLWTPNLVVVCGLVVVGLLVLGLVTGWVPSRRRRD